MNGWRDGGSLVLEWAERAGVVSGVHLQIADRCNHACEHCYQVQGQKGELSFEQLVAVLDDLARSGVLMLNVSGGEATLRDDLVPLLRAARERGFAVRLYTNAYTIDDALADELAAIGLLEVHVSLYSDDAAEHDAVTRVPGSLARTIAGARRLVSRGVRVTLKTPPVAEGSVRVAALAESLGCGHAMGFEVTPREDGSRDTKRAELTPERLVALGAITPWTPGPDDAAERAARLLDASCAVCSAAVAILPNGEVRPCTDTVLALGNVTERPLREILADSDDVPLLRGLRWADVHGCRDCDLLLACDRCHAAAAHEGGDYLGPYASSCRLARARYAAGAGSLDVLAPETPRATDAVGVPIGPYRIEAPGVLRPVADRTSAIDEERARAFPWIRPDRAWVRGMVSGAGSAPVVPLRRSRDGRPLEGAAHVDGIDAGRGT